MVEGVRLTRKCVPSVYRYTRKGPPVHRIPAIRIHRSKQLAYVRIGGKFHYLGVPGSPESFEKFARLVGALDDSSTHEPQRPGRPARPRRTPAPAPRFVTVAELAHRYLAATVERFGLRDKGSYQAKYAAEALVAEHAALRVTEFGPVAFRNIRSRLVAQGKSRKWVNRLMAAIRRCFKWGIAEELVPPDRLTALKAVDGLRHGAAPESPPRRAADPSAVEATLGHLEGMGEKGAARLVRFLRSTGCRPAEGCNARWGELHLDHDPPCLLPREHKTAHLGIERAVPLNRDALGAIGPRYRLHAPGECVFLNTKGNPFTPNSLLLAIRRAIRATGCPNWSPYGLRHLAATRALALTGSEAAAAALLGHTPRSTIIQRYSRDRLALAAKAAYALEGAG